jgi:AraC family transcriptional regulator, arabinose operon regulatory protein
MKEIIKSFVQDNGYPFFIQMAGISYCDGSYRIERKNCPFYAFEYIIEGEGTLIINSHKFNPKKGDVYILQQSSEHVYFSSQNNPWTKIWFAVRGELVESLLNTYRLNHTYYLADCEVRPFFDSIFSLAQSEPCCTENMNRKASLVFHEMLTDITSKINVNSKTYSPIVAKLKHYIDNNLENDISIKSLSNHIFKSPSQTIRLFKKETGITPYEYLLQKRMEIAKLLLHNTNISIKEIAYKLRFADEHYFSNFFKEKNRLSPSSFRKQNTSNESR